MKDRIRLVRKSGNSLVIGITPGAIELLDLKEGDKVEVKTKGKQIVIDKIKGDEK